MHIFETDQSISSLTNFKVADALIGGKLPIVSIVGSEKTHVPRATHVYDKYDSPKVT